MASKQYKSIIRLFNHCGIDYGEDFNLSRAKKQLQAEFRVAREGLIEIDGHTYTQHEVLEEIDHPDFATRLSFHKQIWESPDLLQLLEENVADLSTIKEAFYPFWSNKEFDEFFSPFFAGPFSYISRNLLSENKLQAMGDLLGFEDFLQPAEREEAYRPVRVYLDENLRLLKNVNKENYKIIRPKITHWIDEEWFPFFNCLPHEFYDVKVDIVTKLVNIGVDVQKSRKKDCRKMSQQLVSLSDLPESLRTTISSNHLIFSSGKSAIKGQWLWIWVGILIVKAIASKGCEDDSPKIKFDPKTPIIITDSALQKFRDSILKDNPGAFPSRR